MRRRQRRYADGWAHREAWRQLRCGLERSWCECCSARAMASLAAIESSKLDS